MPKFAWAGLGTVGGLVTGIFIGLQLQPPPAPAATRAEARHESPAGEPAPPSPAPAGPAAAAPKATAPAPPAPPAPADMAAAAKLIQENARLAAELAKTKGDLNQEQAKEKALDGEAIPAPQNLPPRFSQQAIFDATEKALKEAGFDKAQVTSIDCTEYPCIVYGDGMGNREDFHRLQQTQALADYQGDGTMSMGWASGSENGPERFGFAVYQKDSSQDQSAISKRVQVRAQQMMDSGN